MDAACCRVADAGWPCFPDAAYGLGPDAASGNTSDGRIYFEIDAFLGDARRVYESIRKVLWNPVDGGPLNVASQQS